ncbi:MAG: response regulator [Pseudomonadota bacterium]
MITGKERILVVDDEEYLVETMDRMLKKLGYEVEYHVYPEKALDSFQSDPSRFDLVITDMTMPKMQGDNLAKRILDIRPDIPIILCTGFMGKIDKQQIEEIGICKCLEKPFDYKQLSSAVIESLGNSSEQDIKNILL